MTSIFCKTPEINFLRKDESPYLNILMRVLPRSSNNCTVVLVFPASSLRSASVYFTLFLIICLLNSRGLAVAVSLQLQVPGVRNMLTAGRNVIHRDWQQISKMKKRSAGSWTLLARRWMDPRSNSKWKISPLRNRFPHSRPCEKAPSENGAVFLQPSTPRPQFTAGRSTTRSGEFQPAMLVDNWLLSHVGCDNFTFRDSSWDQAVYHARLYHKA